jgi:acrylyl-CoA reductase (NADPH)
MTRTFRAVYLTQVDGATHAEIRAVSEDDLPEGDVTVAVSHSTINYKDGLAITGRGKVVRSFPMVPGIDFAGTVVESTHREWAAGDEVVLNGWGVGEAQWGGLGALARVSGDWLVRKPDAFTPADTMAIGTAGYTAMLCVMALEAGGVQPGSGDVLVTGAAGGVGSVAIALLAGLGHRVLASTGRPAEAEWLRALGASDIIDRSELSEPGRPFGKERWVGAVDTVGSVTLANVLAQTCYGGSVAACGLAQGADLPGSVLPFILRGVTLYGVDSVMAPLEKRKAAWERLARDLDLAKLASLTETRALGEAPNVAAAILDGRVRGRVVIDVSA